MVITHTTEVFVSIKHAIVDSLTSKMAFLEKLVWTSLHGRTTFNEIERQTFIACILYIV